MSKIVLTQYTDPNCIWSWGAEPIMRRMEMRYGHQLTIDFVLGGLIRDFDDFHDAANDIREPEDVAPHWEEASREHGMPVDVGVWEENPPRSTYPACIATRAAGLQGPELGFRYLRRLREVTATERRDIARRDTLIEVGETVGVDLDLFLRALEDGRAERAFRQDLTWMQRRGVRGFPTFELEVDGDARILGTYQPFERLERALLRRAPDLQPRELPPVPAFVDTYGYVATREVAEVYEVETRRAREALGRLEEAGTVRSVRRGNGIFWMPAGSGPPDRRGTGEIAHGSDHHGRDADTRETTLAAPERG